MATLFLLLIVALEGLHRYGLQHVRYNLLNVFYSSEMTNFENIFHFENKEKSQVLRTGEWGAGKPQECLLRPKIMLWRGQCDMVHCHVGTPICLQSLVSRE